MQNINCKYIDKGFCCTNEKVERYFLGWGPGLCVEYGTDNKCDFKKPYPRPAPPKKE